MRVSFSILMASQALIVFLFSLSAMAHGSFSIDLGTAFKCKASGINKDVQKCVGKIDGYPRPVLIYIPNQIDEAQSFNLVYHFHGFNIAHDNDTNTRDPISIHFDETNTQDGDFATWMDQAKFNGVIIAPLSLGDDSTFIDYFSDASNTNHFFETTESLIQAKLPVKTKINVSLSSHSGADQVLNEIAENLDPVISAQITHIGLFDSMYARRDSLVSLIADRQINVFDSYLIEGSTNNPDRDHQATFSRSLSHKWQEKNEQSMPPGQLHVSKIPQDQASHWTLMSDGQYASFLAGLNVEE